MKSALPKLLHCERCGYDWLPRVPRVRQCPKCKSTIWNKTRRAA